MLDEIFRDEEGKEIEGKVKSDMENYAIPCCGEI